MEFFTIGVYNSSEHQFFSKISENNIDTFVDIRQRRGVRGAKYAFVNSKRLQDRLAEMSVKYLHIIDLAPTKEIRELQKEADKQKGEQKRERQRLGDVFRIEYKNRIISHFNFKEFIAQLQEINAKRVVLFCVEEHPEACHRALVTDKLNKDLDFKTTNL
jgi:uncharacterized protein (DUF488 family)